MLSVINHAIYNNSKKNYNSKSLFGPLQFNEEQILFNFHPSTENIVFPFTCFICLDYYSELFY
jgi:hypothetical protein